VIPVRTSMPKPGNQSHRDPELGITSENSERIDAEASTSLSEVLSGPNTIVDESIGTSSSLEISGENPNTNTTNRGNIYRQQGLYCAAAAVGIGINLAAGYANVKARQNAEVLGIADQGSCTPAGPLTGPQYHYAALIDAGSTFAFSTIFFGARWLLESKLEKFIDGKHAGDLPLSERRSEKSIALKLTKECILTISALLLTAPIACALIEPTMQARSDMFCSRKPRASWSNYSELLLSFILEDTLLLALRDLTVTGLQKTNSFFKKEVVEFITKTVLGLGIGVFPSGAVGVRFNEFPRAKKNGKSFWSVYRGAIQPRAVQGLLISSTEALMALARKLGNTHFPPRQEN